MGDGRRKIYWALLTGEHRFCRVHGAACQNDAKTAIACDATIATNRWLEILRSGADLPIIAPSLEQALATISFVDIVRSTEKAARLGICML